MAATSSVKLPTRRKLASVLKTRFGGKLYAGPHCPDGKACAHEFLACCMGLEWTDSPDKTRSWDLRSLNDIPVSETVRAKCMLPVIAAYVGSMDWSVDRQRAVANRLVILLVNRVISELPGLTDDVREKCREAKTLAKASIAARGAASEAIAAIAARDTAYAAYAARAARAAHYAAVAAGYVASERIFRQCCEIWLEAAKA